VSSETNSYSAALIRRMADEVHALATEIRAVLARWGRPAPPPAAGEVGELIEGLKLISDGMDAMGHESDSWFVARAADLLAQRHPAPVPVSERLPGPNTKVLAHYYNALGNGRTICAIWVPAKSRSDYVGDDDDDFTEYDEEDNKFYWPEGWYEQIENWEELGWVKVYEGEVVYWQPLPKWPALPLPAGEYNQGENNV
jgi:hypothetical protein